MPTINIIADAQKAVSETLRFNNELNNLKNRMTELTAENQRYNASGQLVSSTIKGLTNDNQKFTAVLRENKGQMELVNIQYTKMKQKATEASTVTKDLEKGLADLNRVAGFFATYNLFAGFMNSVQFATQEANKFQIQLSLIRTISQDNQLSFRQWSKEIRMVSDQLGEPLADVAKATYDAISNQIAKGPAVPTFILSAGDLARTTGATVTDSVNLLSSAITTYNKPVSEANYLSALFFKTVDEGRVVVSEMANVFGRVGVQAKAVGVTIEETTATVAFLTKQGVLTSDAFTFMTNLLTQLQKPSKELQAFLNSIGSPTGQLAIARFGFAGFIEKLTEEVKTGNVAATDFFKEIRAEKPFEAISNNFADFKKVTQTFSDAKGLVQNYQKAIDIRGESPADFLNKEFNKVKNLLTEDIGQNILRITTQIVQGAQSIDKFLGGNGSLASGVDRLVNLLRDGIVVMLSFRTATAVAATAAAVLTTQTTAAGVAATVTTTRYQILGATFSRMGIGLIAAGIGLIASRWAFANEQVVKQSDAIDALQERYKKMIEVRNTSVIGEDPNKAFLNQAGNQISGGLDVLAKASVIINQRISVLRDANKRQAEEIGNTFNRYLESLNRGINDMQTKIKEAETLLRNTSKNLVNFQNSLQDNLTQTRLKYATDQQKIVILSTEIDALTQKAEAGLASGDPVQVAEAEKIYDNIIKLATERFSIEEEIRKSQIASGFHIVNTARLEQFQNNLLERRKAITDQMVAAKEKDIETTQKQVDIEKTRAENIKDAFKKFNEFSVTEADGQVKARYKNPVTDRIDTEKVKNEYAQVIKNLEDSLGNDYQTRIGLESTLAERKKLFNKEIAETERAETLRTAQNKALVAKNELETNLGNLRKQFEEEAANNKKKQGELAAQVQATKDLAAGLPDFAKSFSVDFGKLGFNTARKAIGLPDLPTDFYATNSKAAADLQTAFKDQGQLNLAISEYQKSLEAITKNSVNVNGVLIPREQDLRNSKQLFLNLADDISKALTPAALAAGLPSGENVFFPGTSIPVADYRAIMLGIFKELEDSQNKLRNNFNKQETTKANFDQQIGSQLEKLRELVPELGPLVQKSATQMNSGFDSTTRSINDAIKAVQTLKAEIGSLNKPNIGAIAGGLGMAGQGYANGGIVGGPRGTDTVPAWLTPGEFVINRNAAAQFSDVLHQINSFRSSGPIYRAAGGNVSHSTSIGDINIHVNGAKSPRETAREVGRHLRTETRRNNLRKN